MYICASVASDFKFVEIVDFNFSLLNIELRDEYNYESRTRKRRSSIDEILFLASLNQGMNSYGCTRATHGVLYIILEIALDYPHEFFIARNNLCR